MTGMPVRGVSVLPAMSRSFVTGAAPVWSRDIGKSGAMLMRGLIITEQLNRHNLSPPTPPNPAPRQCIYAHHNAEQLRGQREGVWGGETAQCHLVRTFW